MRPAAPLLVALSLFSFVSPTDELSSQEVGSALEITVRTNEDDRPLSGAQVIIDGAGVRGVTDRAGFLRVSGLAQGEHRVRVSYLGYAPMDKVFTFRTGRPTRVLTRMSVQPIALQEVSVRARQSVLALRGFFERKRFGQGTYITRDEIQAMRPRFMSDVLRRVSGIQVGVTHFGWGPNASIRGSSTANLCPIQYYVDGTLTVGFNIDYVQPGDVEALEIYRGAATVPPEYNKGTALCGVILIWTRME